MIYIEEMCKTTEEIIDLELQITQEASCCPIREDFKKIIVEFSTKGLPPPLAEI